MREVISVKNGITRMPEWRLAEPVNFVLNDNEHIAVIGKNGSGKSMLIDIITGRHPLILNEPVYNFEPSKKKLVSDNIKYITFKDSYGDNDATYYLQQRWNQHDIDEDTPKVQELLEEAYHMYGEDTIERRYYQTHLYKLLDIEHLLDKYIILLSSGELRKFLIVRTLLSRPRVLILDNPFIGLDAPSRDLLVEMLGQMTKLNGVQVVLLLSNPNDIPAMITHVLPIHDRTCLPPLTREEFMSDTELIARLFPTEGIHACEEVGKVRLPVDMNKIASLHEVTLRMEHVKIRYGSRTILKDLDWEIKNGEKWALFGPNGAGKSTLLSLVYADNPQSYANTLYLFDRKRGSGESIWDIKKRIGYVSPEMHLYYKENVPTLNIVGSGFFDSIGLFRKCNAEQETVALEWMKVFGIEHLKDRLFLTLSSGEQRLALLARAFVKDPDLIILDEPLHGLDVSNKKKAAAIIEQFCDRPGKTLIYVTHYPHELPACVDKRFELVKHS